MRHGKILNFGKYKGHAFERACSDYVAWALGELTEDSNMTFKLLGRYFEDRRYAESTGTSFMATEETVVISDDEQEEASASENDLIAFLYSGCNKTYMGTSG